MQVARVECLSSGKQWDDVSCSCLCPRRTWRPCSTGFSFDYRHSCQCVRVHAAAAGGVLTALVVLFSAVLLVLGGALVHFKRRRDLDERRQRVLDDVNAAAAVGAAAREVVESELTKAFAEDERERPRRDAEAVAERSGT